MMTTLSKAEQRVLNAARDVRRTRAELAAVEAKAKAAREAADELERQEREAIVAVTALEAELDEAVQDLPLPAETQGGEPR